MSTLFAPSRPCTILRATLVVLLVLLGAATSASAGWWDDLDRGQTAELRDVIARPSQYQGRILSMFCIYLGTDTVFAPLAAPYNPERHENFAVWADGAPLWEKKAYANYYPFLYMDRSHPQHGEMIRLERFTRIEVTCRIRGQIRYRPCLEIRSFRRTGHRLGPAVIKSIMAGDRYAEAGQLDLSYENYRRALQPDLPPAYDLQVRKRVAEALRRLGRIDEAMAMEGERILGGSETPEERPRPDGGYLGDPMPGTPGTPATPGTFPEPTAPTHAPISRNPDDLPGTPAPTPFSRDLPGTPAGDAPSDEAPAPPPVITADPPGNAVPPEPPVEPSQPPAVAPSSPVPAPPVETVVPKGAPPRQPPRLSGVK